MWIGGRKGRAGGNPSGVNRSSGDMPADSDMPSSGFGRRNLYAMLLKGAGAGVAGAHVPAPRLPPWKGPGLMGSSSSSGIEAPMPPPPDFPTWIQVDAHLNYRSNTGKIMEVIVEKISVQKGEVKINFADDPKVWKIIKIPTITSKENPLLGVWGHDLKEDHARDRSRSPRK
mmetsp:Transcript_8591/g.13617  ORF Transcript_8591/g.13617 Transcript_8591/m.13617 type:complete len:172 (+) Transcript_8591:58-573(+)